MNRSPTKESRRNARKAIEEQIDHALEARAAEEIEQAKEDAFIAKLETEHRNVSFFDVFEDDFSRDYDNGRYDDHYEEGTYYSDDWDY